MAAAKTKKRATTRKPAKKGTTRVKSAALKLAKSATAKNKKSALKAIVASL